MGWFSDWRLWSLRSVNSDVNALCKRCFRTTAVVQTERFSRHHLGIAETLGTTGHEM